LTLLWIDGQSRGKDANIRTNYAVIANLDLTHIIDGTVAPDHNVVADGDVISIITNEGCFDGNMSANAANVCDRGSLGGRNSNGVAGLQNFEEQASALIGRYAMGRGTSKVVESPACGRAAFTLQAKLLVERIVVSPRQHLLLLGPSLGELGVR
jgi:hypothetical protein